MKMLSTPKHMYLILILTISATISQAHEFPMYVKKLPAHTRGLLYIRNFQEWKVSKAGIQLLKTMLPQNASLEQPLPDEFILAMLETGKGDNVEILVGVPGDDIAANWQVLQKLSATFRLKLPADKPEGTIKARKKSIGFLRQGLGWVWFANNEAVAMAAAAGTLGNSNNLAKNMLFRQAVKGCDFDADVFLYLDLEESLLPLLNREFAGRYAWCKRFFHGLNLAALRATAFSFNRNGGSGTVVLDGSNSGLTNTAFSTNNTSILAARVPENASFIKISLNTGVDILRLCKTVGADIDYEIAREMETELAQFKKKNGVDLEQDILANITSEAIFYTLSSRKRGALLCGIKNRKIFEDNLNRLFGLWQNMPAKETLPGGNLYIKSFLGFGVAEDFFCIGTIEDVRHLLSTAHPLVRRKWCMHPSSALASVDIHAAAMANLKNSFMSAMLLPAIPKRINITATRKGSLIKIQIKTESM